MRTGSAAAGSGIFCKNGGVDAMTINVLNIRFF